MSIKKAKQGVSATSLRKIFKKLGHIASDSMPAKNKVRSSMDASSIRKVKIRRADEAYLSTSVEAKETDIGKALFAKEDIGKDEILIRLGGRILKNPTRTSLQVGEGKHLEGPGRMDDFLNHSCDANGYMNFDDLTFRSKRKIKKGEELTFNYLTTEWDMANKFECRCGSRNCFGRIRGFRYLTKKQRLTLGPYLSPFLRKKLGS